MKITESWGNVEIEEESGDKQYLKSFVNAKIEEIKAFILLYDKLEDLK